MSCLILTPNVETVSKKQRVASPSLPDPEGNIDIGGVEHTVFNLTAHDRAQTKFSTSFKERLELVSQNKTPSKKRKKEIPQHPFQKAENSFLKALKQGVLCDSFEDIEKIQKLLGKTEKRLERVIYTKETREFLDVVSKTRTYVHRFNHAQEPYRFPEVASDVLETIAKVENPGAEIISPEASSDMSGIKDPSERKSAAKKGSGASKNQKPATLILSLKRKLVRANAIGFGQEQNDLLQEFFKKFREGIVAYVGKHSYSKINLHLLQAYALMMLSKNLFATDQKSSIPGCLKLAQETVDVIDVMRASDKVSIPSSVSKSFDQEIDAVKKKVKKLTENPAADVDLSNPVPYLKTYLKRS